MSLFHPHATRLERIGFATAFAIACGSGGWLGFRLEMPQSRTFELVQFHGEESDIVDFDLSAMDCAKAARLMRGLGLDATCNPIR